MRKKHGPVRTAARPSSSMNHDRFKRLPCFNLKTTSFHPFPPLYGVVPPFFFNPLSKITSASSLLWNPLSITFGVFLNPHSLNHSLVSASLSITLPRCRHTVAAQPKFLPHSLKVSITLSSLPLSLVAVAAQPRSQLTLSRSSLPLSLVPVAAHSVPRRRRRRWYFNLFFLC